jgi:hypothetical protein
MVAGFPKQAAAQKMHTMCQEAKLLVISLLAEPILQLRK